MKDFKLDARAIIGMSALMHIGMHLPTQEMLLDAANELISETRESIVSGGKSPDEVNELLDKLQELTLKKHNIEIRVRQLKRMHEIVDKNDNSSEDKIILKEDNRTLKEIIEGD